MNILYSGFNVSGLLWLCFLWKLWLPTTVQRCKIEIRLNYWQINKTIFANFAHVIKLLILQRANAWYYAFIKLLYKILQYKLDISF